MDLPRTKPRLGRPRLLIVGCGDVGLHIVARLRGRFRIFGVVRGESGAAAVRQAGALPLRLDLDRREGLQRLQGLAPRVLLLAPTSAAGAADRRSQRLLAALRRPPPGGRMVYLSTTGVYGDRGGAWTDESVPARPQTPRSRRRLDAEQRLRKSAWHAAVLRAPGIYGPRRLPLERLRAGIPVAHPAQDVYTNHIHVEDLARASILASLRARRGRVYNVVDDTQLRLGEYLDRVAALSGLAPPRRVHAQELHALVDPLRLSFLEESRRLRNRRLKRELRLRLCYPDVEAGLRAPGALAPAPGASAQAANRFSTER